ncbi:hypothetical protein HU200_048235 [Digitaria exilis]|uniref:Uncharacterized protein n=1 Tax=Digitaria exilis TaxID=1010633 RepID=A0A835EB23_9POAL|nr:hypothetical protein HU200_048235 [Digitaria exilis]
MARRLCATRLPLILVISFLLLGVSNCSRPFSPEQHRPRAPTAPPAAHRDVEAPHHLDAAEARTRPTTVAITEDDDDGQSRRWTRADGGAAAAPASMAMVFQRDKDGHGGVVGVGSSGHRSALLRLPAPVLRRGRSKFARRRFLLAGTVEGADSAARASCRSNDVHISCTPPLEH